MRTHADGTLDASMAIRSPVVLTGFAAVYSTFTPPLSWPVGAATTEYGSALPSPAAARRCNRPVFASCKVSTSTCSSRTVRTICWASAKPFLVFKVMTRAYRSAEPPVRLDTDGSSWVRSSDVQIYPQCQHNWVSKHNVHTTASARRRPINAHTSVTAETHAIHGTNATTTGMYFLPSSPLGVMRRTMMPITASVISHKTVNNGRARRESSRCQSPYKS